MIETVGWWHSIGSKATQPLDVPTLYPVNHSHTTHYFGQPRVTYFITFRRSNLVKIPQLDHKLLALTSAVQR